MKIARLHILNTIGRALEISRPVEYAYSRYIISATPYRQRGKKGNTGVKVTWRKNAEEEKPVGEKKEKKKPAKAKKKKKGKK